MTRFKSIVYVAENFSLKCWKKKSRILIYIYIDCIICIRNIYFTGLGKKHRSEDVRETGASRHHGVSNWEHEALRNITVLTHWGGPLMGLSLDVSYTWDRCWFCSVISLYLCIYTEKTFWNLINSNRNQIVFTIFRLIWNIKRALSVWQFKRKMVNTIWFRFELMRFQKVFSVCR